MGKWGGGQNAIVSRKANPHSPCQTMQGRGTPRPCPRVHHPVRARACQMLAADDGLQNWEVRRHVVWRFSERVNMAKVDPIPVAARRSVVLQLAQMHAPIVNSRRAQRAASRQPELAESFAVCHISAEHVQNPPAELSALVKPSGVWHHQIHTSGRATHTAQSREARFAGRSEHALHQWLESPIAATTAPFASASRSASAAGDPVIVAEPEDLSVRVGADAEDPACPIGYPPSKEESSLRKS